MKISLLMTAYQRATLLDSTLYTVSQQTRRPDQIVIVEDGFDDGKTKSVCERWKGAGLPIEYYCRKNRPDLGFSNPGVPKNIGIRKASGDIVILQCAEVKYGDPKDIDNLVRPVEEDAMVSNFAVCERLDSNGANIGVEYPHLFVEYSQAVRRDAVMAIGGYQECFRGYAFEDCEFQDRLKRSGIRFRRASDVVVYHQHHERTLNGDRMYWDDMSKSKEISSQTVANVGREWGDINS